jgi:ParB family chromosome partitioning protein
MKLDAIRHQGRACGHSVHKSRDEVTDSESGRTVSRYIRLTELVPELLQMVDENTMALRPAVELSYLPQRAQKWVIEQMDIQSCTPSHAQTIRLRQLHEQGQLTEKETAQILAEQKPNQVETIRLPTSKLKAYFPKNYTPRQIEEKILVILEQWRKLERKRAARDAR